MVKATLLDKKPKKYDGLWLSVSKIKSFDQCPAKYRYCYIERLPSKPWDHFTFGNFMHKVLEDFYAALIKGDKTPYHKLMTNIFKEVAKSEEFSDSLTMPQKKESWDILYNFLKMITKQKDSPDVLSVESKFYIDINDGEVLLNGLIDRVQIDPDGILHVADYKTTKNKKYLVGDYFQLLTYAYVMCLNDTSIETLKASYILLRHNFESITQKYNRKRIMQVGKELVRYADKIINEKLWRPKPSKLCSWCDYNKECPSFNSKSFDPGRKKDTTFGKISW
jgi:putative RecB family exonuclease